MPNTFAVVMISLKGGTCNLHQFTRFATCLVSLTQPDSLNVRPGIHVPLQLESKNCPWPLFMNSGTFQEDFLMQIAIVVCIPCAQYRTSDFGAYVL